MGYPIFNKLKKTLYSLEILTFIIFVWILYGMMPGFVQNISQFLWDLSYEIVMPALGYL